MAELLVPKLFSKGKAKKKSKKKPPVPFDALYAENAQNMGDIPTIPRKWQQPALANQKYRIKRTVDSSDISQVAATDTFPTYRFKLDDFGADVAEFTALFDMYRFRYIRLIFRPRFNLSAVMSIAAIINPNLYTVIDYNDNTALATLTNAREYQSLKETRFDQDHIRFITPQAVDFSTGVNTGAFMFKNKWLSIADTATYHHGIKAAIPAGAAAQTALQSWSVEIEYFVEFMVVK